MLTLFEEIRADLVDKAVVLAAIFFHDIIYNPKSSTNEDVALTI
jgi:predicted metal-dependent HD superfamily phosphohydrolase